MMVGMKCHNSNMVDGWRETPFTMFSLKCNKLEHLTLLCCQENIDIFDLFLEVVVLLQKSSPGLHHFELASFDISLLLVGLYGVERIR